jgi:hypothetical protein
MHALTLVWIDHAGLPRLEEKDEWLPSFLLMLWMAGLERRYPKRLFRWNGSGVVVRRRASSAAARLAVYGMSLADAVDPLPLRVDPPAPSPGLSFWEKEGERMVYLNSGSSLPPAARPSDALRKRKRSLRRHFLLPLPHPRVLGDGGEEGRSSSSPPLNGDSDRVALLLLDGAAEEALPAAGLPLSNASAAVS